MTDTTEAPAPPGHNNPPEPTPYEAVSIHIDDLLLEARNWADGTKVENQAQADEVARLISDLKKAEKAADDARKDEVRPLDDARDAIQERYNVYIAPLKNKKPGKLLTALEALKATLTPWLQALEAAKRAEEQRARDEANRLAEEAAAALRATDVADLAGREAAEELVEDAAAAEAAAKRAARDKAHAHTGERAMGLRTSYRANMTDRKAALMHYLRREPAAFVGLLQQLADRDVRAGQRAIPGFKVEEEQKL